MISLRYIYYKEAKMYDSLTNVMGVLTGWIAILMPVLLIWVIFYFSSKNDKEKYKRLTKAIEGYFYRFEFRDDTYCDYRRKTKNDSICLNK